MNWNGFYLLEVARLKGCRNHSYFCIICTGWLRNRQNNRNFAEVIVKGGTDLLFYKKQFFVEKDSIFKLVKGKSTTVETASGFYQKEDKQIR